MRNSALKMVDFADFDAKVDHAKQQADYADKLKNTYVFIYKMMIFLLKTTI